MYTMIRTEGQDVREIELNPRTVKTEEQARKAIAKWAKRQPEVTWTLKH